MKDAQTKPSEEECASSMVQRLHSNYAILKDVQTKPSDEEYALGMEQRKRPDENAAVRVAQIMPRKEECASNMGLRSNDAISKDAQIMLREEECAEGTEQRSNNAAVKDALNKL